ncbi:hypothetical protein KR009_004967, partial [Drosophila setifemur]
RSTRSTKATLSLSNFFDTPEDAGEDLPGGHPTLETEANVPSPKIKPIRASNVFEKPGPKPKKAPKLKGSSSSSTSTSRRGRGRSKQQPSISNFLRNEQIFSEVTAQHCMADNFSPDDIEMALALSKSEAEKQGCLRLNDDEDAVVELVDDDTDASKENVRRKLQKYGFRTAAKEDYKSLAILPVTGKGSRRCKWANKFTALTLRNPEVQQKKLNEKVSALLAQQVLTRNLTPKERLIPPYELISSSLQKLRALPESLILQEPSEGGIADLGLYYVTDLIEVSQAPAHHLLKSWAAIQGRDLSPERETSKSRERKRQLDLAYMELEKHFEEQHELDQRVVDELDDLEKLVVENMIEDDSKLSDNIEMDASSTSSSPLKEPPDKRPKIAKDDKENLQPVNSACLDIPTHITRCPSPDLFADSDDEADIPTTSITNESQDVKEFSLKVYQNSSTNESSSPSTVREVKSLPISEEASQITIYEVFSSSSDEGKNSEFKKEIKKKIFNYHFIDLTQNHKSDTEESHSIAFSLDSDPEVDNFNFTLALDPSSQEKSCPISTDLYMKYAKLDKQTSNATDEEDKHEHSFGLERDLQSSEHSSFHLDIVTNPNDTKRSSSFSELNFSRNSLQRSVSLSTDHSFRSPLDWKIMSSADKQELPAPSAFKHSDASIDLTQNSDDENDAILLSDEEINYSIWKANKTAQVLDFENESSDSSCVSPAAKKRAVPIFQTEEDLDAYLMAAPGAEEKSKSSRSPNKSALSRERAEFGILDAEPSQPFSLSEMQSPLRLESPSNSDINWSEASFLDAPVKPFPRKSSHKFDDLLAKLTQPESLSDNDFDEFDQIVFQKQPTTETMPSGLDQLLKGEIKLPELPSTSKQELSDLPDQVEVDGNVYTVRVCHTPKPDFANLPESEILQQLYNYGIKPLKRKQAVKMLEFIYNQTHPIMQTASLKALPDRPRLEPLARSKSTPVMREKPCSKIMKSINKDCLTPTEPLKYLKFKDGTGEQLLRFSQSQPPSLCDDFECYILQTNVSKKTPQPLLPFHIAWHNLISANPDLHERVLMYEPIDLQEIYLHLKQMGHRYDPKDLRTFFDRRCIIFRYDLTAPGKQAERHVRKKPKKASRKP